MIKIAVCDDEQVFAQLLFIQVQKFMKNHDADFHVDLFLRSSELLDSCIKNHYDLLLLDIDMPELNGFDVSEQIKKLGIRTETIFVSGRENFVFRSIKYRPFRFIRKSCLDEELDEALTDFLKQSSEQNSLFTFRFEDSSVSIPINNIMYVDSYNHDITICTDDSKVYRLNRKYNLRELEKQFSRHGFIRIHKSYLVNYRFIRLIKETNIVLNNETVLPSSKQRISGVKSQYRALIMGES